MTNHLFILLLSLSSFISSAQQNFTIDPYHGTVYDLTEEDIEAGYGKHIYENENLGKVIWDKIDIPDRPVTKSFTDIEFITLFGVVLESKIHVEKSACFEFIINSDDGSKVWINENLLIDNGGVHKMRSKKAILQLPKGSHHIKIWYFQAFKTRYGLQFNINQLDKSCDEIHMENEALKPKTITLSNNILFNKDEFEIKSAAIPELDSIGNLIKKLKPKRIKVVGHTDSTGAKSYNLILSKKRAISILKYLKGKVNDPEIGFLAVGLGESMAGQTGTNEAENEKNRRVEIIFEALIQE